jgi:hypothetical protein
VQRNNSQRRLPNFQNSNKEIRKFYKKFAVSDGLHGYEIYTMNVAKREIIFLK